MQPDKHRMDVVSLFTLQWQCKDKMAMSWLDFLLEVSQETYCLCSNNKITLLLSHYVLVCRQQWLEGLWYHSTHHRAEQWLEHLAPCWVWFVCNKCFHRLHPPRRQTESAPTPRALPEFERPAHAHNWCLSWSWTSSHPEARTGFYHHLSGRWWRRQSPEPCPWWILARSVCCSCSFGMQCWYSPCCYLWYDRYDWSELQAYWKLQYQNMQSY